MTRKELADYAIKFFGRRLREPVLQYGERQAINIALAALHNEVKLERSEPLTIEELRQLAGVPVWVVDKTKKTPDMGGWCVMYEDASCALVPGCECWEWDVKVYGKTWIAYRRKPKEVGVNG